MFNVEGFVKLLMYVNNVVDVAFKLSISNLVKVEIVYISLNRVRVFESKSLIDNFVVVVQFTKSW